MSQRLWVTGILGLCAAVAWDPPAHAQGRVHSTDLVNIAAAANGGRIISFSTVLDDDPKFAATNLIDGQVWNPAGNSGSYGWASNKYDPINMEQVTIGFPDNKVRSIGKIVLHPTAAVTRERWAKDVEVLVSTESAEGPFKPVAQCTLKNRPERQEFLLLPADARFVRLKFRTNYGSDRAVALGEVEVYEAIEQTNPIGQLITRLEGAIAELKRYRKTQIEGGNSGGTAAEVRTTELSQATIQLIAAGAGGAAGGRLPVSSVNIAAAKNGGKVMNHSTTLDKDPAYGPEKLIDGQNYQTATNTGSYGWSSEGFEPGKQFVTLGFREDRTRLIGKIVVNPVSYQPAMRWARSIDVQATTGSAKDGPWRSITVLNLRMEPVNQEFILRPVEAKYLRFVFMANGPGDFSLPNQDPRVSSNRAVSLGEIEVYEATASGDVLDALIGDFDQVLIDLKRLRTGSVSTAATEAPETLAVVQPTQAPLPLANPPRPAPALSGKPRGKSPASRISTTTRATAPKK